MKTNRKRERSAASFSLLLNTKTKRARQHAVQRGQCAWAELLIHSDGKRRLNKGPTGGVQSWASPSALGAAPLQATSRAPVLGRLPLALFHPGPSLPRPCSSFSLPWGPYRGRSVPGVLCRH